MLQGLSRAMPFLGIAVIVYAVGVLALGIPVENPVAAVPLPSGGLLRIVFGDGVVLLALVLFFVELLISTRPTRSSLVTTGCRWRSSCFASCCSCWCPPSAR
jgi:hypothetical protein